MELLTDQMVVAICEKMDLDSLSEFLGTSRRYYWISVDVFEKKWERNARLQDSIHKAERYARRSGQMVDLTDLQPGGTGIKRIPKISDDDLQRLIETNVISVPAPRMIVSPSRSSEMREILTTPMISERLRARFYSLKETETRWRLIQLPDGNLGVLGDPKVG